MIILMRTTTLQFTQSARRVYTSVKRAVEKCGQFRHVVPNDDTFVITARHGMSLMALGEKITIHVVATGTQSSKVVIELANQIFINILNLGANKKNVQSLEDYISNEVYRLCNDAEIKFRQPEIRMRK
ncbi:MAG: hypothetical protein KBT57_07925 [bacterium]|nr:hypothetical protein [Candidatus Limimorpha equi]